MLSSVDGLPGAVFLLVLAWAMAVSVIARKPWTSPLAALIYRKVSGTPLFQTINMVMSALWALLVAWLAVAWFAQLPMTVRFLPLAAGGVVSMILPPVWIWTDLKRHATGDRRNLWPVPDFSQRADEAFDVAVIGSGIGGLTAAALLADKGLKVIVLEQHDRPGGFCHHWIRRARDRETQQRLLFRFDSGVHDFSGWWPDGTLDVLLKRLAKSEAVSWRQLDHRFDYDGVRIDVPREWRDLVDRLARQFPREATGIARLFDEIHEIYRAMYATARHHNGFPGAPQTPADAMAFAREFPLAAAWMERPWRRFLERHVSDTAARTLIEGIASYRTHDPALISVGAMVPLFAYYFIGGAYPAGGSGHFAQVLADAILERGGEVRLRTGVTRILQEDGVATGVVTRDHRGNETTIRATALVCNADAATLVGELLEESPQRREMRRQFGQMVPSCSAVGMHLGVRGAIDAPPIVHVKDGETHTEVIFTAAADPSCAPGGYSTIDLFQLVPADQSATWFPPAAPDKNLKQLRRSQEYLDRKAQMSASLLDAARHIVPDLDARIVYQSDASPVTFHRYGWTGYGAIYGLRNPAGGLPIRTPLRNLVLAGAMTQGGGIEPAALAGVFAAKALLPDVLVRGGWPHVQAVVPDSKIGMKPEDAHAA